MRELKNQFTTDPNLKYAGVRDDLILIMQCTGLNYW